MTLLWDIVWRAAALCALAGAIGVGANQLRPGGLQWSQFTAPTSCEGAEHPAAEIAPGDAAKLCAQGNVIIADARGEDRFSQGHIAGAVHLPCEGDGRATNAALESLRGATTVLVYGDSTAQAANVAAGILRRAPSLDVRVLAGGFAAWAGSGLACASGPCDDCKKTTPTASSGMSSP